MNCLEKIWFKEISIAENEDSSWIFFSLGKDKIAFGDWNKNKLGLSCANISKAWSSYPLAMASKYVLQLCFGFLGLGDDRIEVLRNWNRISCIEFQFLLTGTGFLDFQSGSGPAGIKKKTGIPVA